MHLKVSAKRRPFCLGLDELTSFLHYLTDVMLVRSGTHPTNKISVGMGMGPTQIGPHEMMQHYVQRLFHIQWHFVQYIIEKWHLPGHHLAWNKLIYVNAILD